MTSQVERTCVGCRAKDARGALLRFRVTDGVPPLAPDVRGRLGGRGVSVHPRRSCVAAAAQKGGFARALRRAVAVDPDALSALAASQYRRRAEGLLLSARRTGGLFVGTDAVREALSSGRVSVLVVAEDAANRRDELTQVAARLGSACVIMGTRAELGRVLGRVEVGVAAVADAGIGRELHEAAARAQALSEDS